MTSFFIRLFEHNHMENITYAEPYAGGVGAGINLLVLDKIERLIINDANIGIYSFWKSFVNDPDRFIGKVRDVNVSLEEWERQHHIYKRATEPSVELGFAVFFLSRTNRSGILSAGPIGGRNVSRQETATYKINCRFNKPMLIKRLETIAAKADQISVHNLDAIDFLQKLDEKTFVYLDPPYFVKGGCLYMNHYLENDHVKLANDLKKVSFRWVLSYDNVPEIRELYKNYDLFRFELSYSAHTSKKGEELLTHSSNISMPKESTIQLKNRQVEIERMS